MANYRGVKLKEAIIMQITVEIMQTYDLLKFAITRSNGSTLVKIPTYNTTWSALHKREWIDWLNRERQMYKCHKP